MVTEELLEDIKNVLGDILTAIETQNDYLERIADNTDTLVEANAD